MSDITIVNTLGAIGIYFNKEKGEWLDVDTDKPIDNDTRIAFGDMPKEWEDEEINE